MVEPGDAVSTLGVLVTCRGRKLTVRVAVLLGVPTLAPVSTLVMPLVVFVYEPDEIAETGMVIVQTPEARLGTVRLRLVVPAARVGELVTPAHVPPIVAGAATLKPVRVSVNFAEVRVLPLGLLSVNVMVDVV